MNKGQRLLSGNQVRRRIGGNAQDGRCSTMHLWRLVNKPEYAHLGFPKPTKINGRNYWLESEIDEFIERMAPQHEERAA